MQIKNINHKQTCEWDNYNYVINFNSLITIIAKFIKFLKYWKTKIFMCSAWMWRVKIKKITCVEYLYKDKREEKSWRDIEVSFDLGFKL